MTKSQSPGAIRALKRAPFPVNYDPDPVALASRPINTRWHQSACVRTQTFFYPTAVTLNVVVVDDICIFWLNDINNGRAVFLQLLHPLMLPMLPLNVPFVDVVVIIAIAAATPAADVTNNAARGDRYVGAVCIVFVTRGRGRRHPWRTTAVDTPRRDFSKGHISSGRLDLRRRHPTTAIDAPRRDLTKGCAGTNVGVGIGGGSIGSGGDTGRLKRSESGGKGSSSRASDHASSPPRTTATAGSRGKERGRDKVCGEGIDTRGR